MTIKQIGGVFGRNPTFNDVETSNLVVENNISSATLTVSGDASAKSLTVSGNSAYGNGKIFTTSGEGLLLGAKTGSFFDAGLLGAGLTNYVYTVATGTNNIKFWGDVTIGNSTAQNHPVNGNLAMASGNGIDFSATSGTGTSELFDDYEEGTWTPSLIGATSGSMSFGSVQLARYTKVGRIVSSTLYMTGGDFSAHTVSGNVLIQGLPYAAPSAGAGVISVAYCNLTTADEADITISGYIEATSLRLLKGSSTSAVTGADLTASGTNGAIMLSIVYETGA